MSITYRRNFRFIEVFHAEIRTFENHFQNSMFKKILADAFFRWTFTKNVLFEDTQESQNASITNALWRPGKIKRFRWTRS